MAVSRSATNTSVVTHDRTCRADDAPRAANYPRLSLALRPVPREQAHHLARLQAGFVPDVLVGERTKPRRERESVCVRYLLRLRVESLWQRHADRHLLGGACGRAALRDDFGDEDATLRHGRSIARARKRCQPSRTHRAAVVARLESTHGPVWHSSTG